MPDCESIREGSFVLLFLDNRRSYLVRVEKSAKFHTHKGFVEFDDVIGEEYGTTLISSLGVEFVALKPLLPDFIYKAQRKSQITYPKDVALMVMFSGIGPGSKIVEAGTGAGALTTALASYVRPDGCVYSYDIRSDFQRIALKNLRKAQLERFVDVKQKDITLGIDETDVDAVILDLATPWLVVPHANAALKGSGSLVSFSPTIDQIVKTVEAMRSCNFVNVTTFECIMRKMQVIRGKTRPQTLMTGHTGYITHGRKASRSNDEDPMNVG